MQPRPSLFIRMKVEIPPNCPHDKEEKFRKRADLSEATWEINSKAGKSLSSFVIQGHQEAQRRKTTGPQEKLEDRPAWAFSTTPECPQTDPESTGYLSKVGWRRKEEP